MLRRRAPAGPDKDDLKEHATPGRGAPSIHIRYDSAKKETTIGVAGRGKATDRRRRLHGRSGSAIDQPSLGDQLMSRI
jgi:hypothetical protein